MSKPIEVGIYGEGKTAPQCGGNERSLGDRCLTHVFWWVVHIWELVTTPDVSM